jgi:hypothetical protein
MHGFCLSRNHGRPNKELKLTKPAFGASQLNSVLGGRVTEIANAARTRVGIAIAVYRCAI